MFIMPWGTTGVFWFVAGHAEGAQWEEGMAVDVRELVGDDNMTLAAKENVIQIFQALQAPATTKRFLYARWARLVGVEPIPADIDRVALWSAGGT